MGLAFWNWSMALHVVELAASNIAGRSIAHENDLGGGIRTWMEAYTSFFVE